ncbi:MAG: dihydropteroate synthase [Synergistaceae bacterium]|nr:dihydropteroate synthase [Candidatus Equadaptatus faecalis]
MRVCRISVNSKDELAEELKKIGANPASLPFFENRRETLALLADSMPCAAANILKQELLSAGGDAAVHAHAVDCRAEASRVLIFADKKQLASVCGKLKQMPWWGFPELADDIKKCSADAVRVRTKIAGIINLTDDSFYAESRTAVSDAVSRAKQLVSEGADLLDLGAESTRPGAERTDESEELEKIRAVLPEIRAALPDVKISVDTTRFSVAKAALEKGADIINDVSGLADENIVKACRDHGSGYVLTHSRGTSVTMDGMCEYDNILLEINSFFERKIELAEKTGLKREKIILDPGFGFAKNEKQNLYLLKNLCAFRGFGLPLLVGVSRKRFLGAELKAEERLEATLSATALCVLQNAEYVRVHDVAANRRAADFCGALKNA